MLYMCVFFFGGGGGGGELYFTDHSQWLEMQFSLKAMSRPAAIHFVISCQLRRHKV